MSRQDKATTDRHARILRELVKQPENKSCADCRKNDARWASWNLGVFLCIRCSGIHRSMGTHISKVKSIDLDVWTPEQMESVQKWGNTRANLYWEKHLKAGHVPPEHKIESFIRSKYESKRWAMDGPPPSDPSVLENGAGQSQASAPLPTPNPTPTSASAAPPAAPAGRAAHPLLSRATAAAKAAPTPAPMVDLFGDDPPAPSATTTAPPLPLSATSPPRATTGAAAPGPTAAPTSNIFDLDFRAPTPQSSKPQTAKSDIMSLFSATSPAATAAPPQQSLFSPPAPPAQNNFGSWGGGITSSAPPVQQTNTAPIGGGWGGIQMDQNAWGAPTQAQAPQAQQSYQQSQQQQQHQTQSGGNVWGSNDPWASNNANSSAGYGGFGGMAPAQKKEEADPFANIWK